MKGEEQPVRSALTRYRCIATTELPVSIERYPPTSRYSLVELKPETGRKHQLRRHMKHISHPIIGGDANHGRGRHNRYFAERFGYGRLMLAATELELSHPATGGEVLRFSAPPPEESFRTVLEIFEQDTVTG